MNGLHPNVGLNQYQLIKKHGYDYQNHIVETEDGYILEMQRVTFINETIEPREKQPILLIHGMFGSSAVFVNNDPEKNIPYILLQQGYDVWMGNSRGTLPSRKHKILDPDEDAKEFWNFSWHEIGYYDIPAMIDYILGLTGFCKIAYIGHSQGGTCFFVMASDRPEYNNKIKIAFTFGGVATTKYYPTYWHKYVVSLERMIKEYLYYLEIYEFLPYSRVILDVYKFLCDELLNLPDLCSAVLQISTGYDKYQLGPEMITVIASTSPAGIALNQVIHYMQIVKNGRFTKFDYHDDNINFGKYGSVLPPEYDLSKVSAPVVMYTAPADVFMHPKERLYMAEILQNATPVEVDFPYFCHIDFVFAKDIVPLIYDDLMDRLNRS